MRVTIVTHRDGVEQEIAFNYQKREDNERPMVLDVLLQAHLDSIPDLAFRYGCRARNCGVCTVDINGKPRIACRARARAGDRISAVATLPVTSDLVARRDGIARQLHGKLAGLPRHNDLNVEAPDDYHALTACIECYACLDQCPMHARNFDGTVPHQIEDKDSLPDPSQGYRWGNPFSLLKIQRYRLDPLTTEPGRQAGIELAESLGLDACIDCPGCKCGVGIDLKRKVIQPLLQQSNQQAETGD
jgi:succinate dehydrogenase/fumarate reductase-like Fe-S protein